MVVSATTIQFIFSYYLFELNKVRVIKMPRGKECGKIDNVLALNPKLVQAQRKIELEHRIILAELITASVYLTGLLLMAGHISYVIGALLVALACSSLVVLIGIVFKHARDIKSLVVCVPFWYIAVVFGLFECIILL